MFLANFSHASTHLELALPGLRPQSKKKPTRQSLKGAYHVGLLVNEPPAHKPGCSLGSLPKMRIDVTQLATFPRRTHSTLIDCYGKGHSR